MPGLSQLKKFNSDLLSLGSEPELRAKRGEKVFSYQIPKGIKDEDDSNDFVMGMPEPDEENIQAAEAKPVVDEDFSDITGTGTGSAASSAPQGISSPDVSVPDLSSLVNFDAASVSGGDENVPDLSMFMDEPVKEEEPEQEEEKAPEIADLSLEDLLNGAGFDGSNGQEEAAQEQDENQNDNAGKADDIPDLDEALSSDETVKKPSDDEFYTGIDKDIFDDKDIPSLDDALTDAVPVSDGEDFSGIPGFTEADSDGSGNLSSDEFGDIPGFTAAGSSSSDDFALPENEESLKTDDFDLSASDTDIPEPASEKDESASSDEFDLPDFDAETPETPAEEKTDAESSQTDDFDLPDFDAESLETSAEEKTGTENPESDDFTLPDFDAENLEASSENEPESGNTENFDLPDLDTEAAGSESEEKPENETAESFDLPDLDAENAAAVPETSDDGIESLESEDINPGESFSLDDLDKLKEDAASENPLQEELSQENLLQENAEPAEVPEPVESAEPLETAGTSESENLSEKNENVEDFLSETPQMESGKSDDLFGLDDLSLDDFNFSAGNSGESAKNGDALSDIQGFTAPDVENAVSLDNADNSEIKTEEDQLSETENASENEKPAEENENTPSGLFDSSDFDLPDMNLSDMDSGSVDGAGDMDKADEFKNSDFGGLDGEKLDDPFSSIQDGETENAGTDSASEGENSSESGAGSSNESDDFLSDFNFNMDDAAVDGEAGNFESNAPAETFDTSEMEGMDFNIPDTDARLAGDFELGNKDDIKLENGDFEIPGFSDVDTVQEEKKGRVSAKKEEETAPSDLPPNTLSDEQYEKFLKNLSFYPLNVRIAVEDLIVKNEFTDDAEFDIIQKVLKKVPARSLASELEKMLDITLSVPRDFERRTQEEYEAYKSSFQYQLRNKIIPGAIISVIAAGFCVLLCLFAKNFIVKPAIANSLYKKGYKLLTQEDYPSSEENFIAATHYKRAENWYFKYARGYREKKQYIRSEKMYENILETFNHNKEAGLEYAEMETTDLANYEKAEEILKHDVLVNHINDKDGILALGDNYLEWGTEKEYSKLFEARDQYLLLEELYGATNLYNSRLMRFFIRTDNLEKVLELKAGFMPKEKSLSGDDWTEMSGFLLDKLYGPLPPSEEYLRKEIEDVKECLLRAVRQSPGNPVSLYNLSRYNVEMKNPESAKQNLDRALKAFAETPELKKRDMYKYIDSYRLLGEQFENEKEFLKARENFTDGITLFQNVQDQSGLEGTNQIGKLYSDLGDLDYFIQGDMKNALINYEDAVKNDNDNAEIRYKIGFIQYEKNNYREALGSFMKASEDYPEDTSLLLAMGNTLSLRNDNNAARGYYEELLSQLDVRKNQKGILLPQLHADDYEVMDAYLKGKNNLGVTLSRIAKRTGNSQLNAKAIASFQDSLRAWDSMTRNQETLVRLSGSNLAEENIRYVTSRISGWEPAIYTDISKTLSVEEGLKP